MNLNNKFGNCCGCPALNNAREFTEHRSSSIYNSEMMKKMTKGGGIKQLMRGMGGLPNQMKGFLSDKS